jgi:AcrR family transcriptional regulator
MSPRAYRSPQRDAAAGATRQRIVAAAAAILGAADGSAKFSLEAVAKKAGVTRLTVYNQFGSRRALMEAVFDERAARGGLFRIAQAMQDPDPHAALLRIIGIFCDFWSSDPGTMRLLHAAGASDPEFAASVYERNERRRQVLSAIVARLAEGRRSPPKALGDVVDVLFALTSFSFFSQLTMGKRTTRAACRMIQELALDAVKRALRQPVKD